MDGCTVTAAGAGWPNGPITHSMRCTKYRVKHPRTTLPCLSTQYSILEDNHQTHHDVVECTMLVRRNLAYLPISAAAGSHTANGVPKGGHMLGRGGWDAETWEMVS
jgi:hypothetical protein